MVKRNDLCMIFAWVAIYACAWSLICIYLNPRVPYDALEAINWASNKNWGSPKNPWLVGAVMQPALWSDAIPLDIYWYVTHFLAISIGLIGVWFFAYELSGNKNIAWISALSLNMSGVINYDIMPYNDNYLLVMLWPWMMLFLTLAFRKSPKWWVPFALVAGLSTMAKYSTASFLLCIFLGSLINKNARRCYVQPYFYFGIFVFSALVIPNLIWLYSHDFAAFKWVGGNVSSGFNPKVIVTFVSVFYPIVILVLILKHYSIPLVVPSKWEVLFVFWVYLCPLVIIFFWFLFHSGERLTEWIQPYLVLAPAILASFIGGVSNIISRKVSTVFFCIAVAVLIGYGTVLKLNIKNTGEYFGGIKGFSVEVERAWSERYKTKLSYVGGVGLSEWVMFYAPSRPKSILKWSNDSHPNIYNDKYNADDILDKGFLLIGDECKDTSFSHILKDLPNLQIDAFKYMEFTPGKGSAPQRVCLGYIKPRLIPPRR